MALIVADRVMESSTTTGTGSFALAGAHTGYRAFDDVMANGDTCYYSIEALDVNGNPSGAWEVGLGTFNDTDTLVRTTPAASSNGGAAVNFVAGTKRVMLNATAGYLASITRDAEATAAEYRANTADRTLTTDKVWSAADYVALTDAATVAVDLSAGINFSLIIGGNRTLGAPSNTKNGQTGAIVITQDGTGSRTLAYHANWKFAGGTDPALSTAAGAIDVFFYQVISSTSIVANLVKAIA